MTQFSNPDIDEPGNIKKPEITGPSSEAAVEDDKAVDVDIGSGEETTPLIGIGECRICQEEDSLKNLESPCVCSGSLKYAHRKCVQHWCNEKGDITCEICHQPYKPGYTAPPRPVSDETAIDIEGVWQISDTQLESTDPRQIITHRRLFDTEYDDYNDVNSSSASFCRSAALILMALLLLRHAVSITDDENGESEEDAATFFSLFLLRVIGFLFPCYIMMWAISILQRRRERQEEPVLGTQFAIVVQSAQSRGVIMAPSETPPSNASSSPVPPELDRV